MCVDHSVAIILYSAKSVTMENEDNFPELPHTYTIDSDCPSGPIFAYYPDGANVPFYYQWGKFFIFFKYIIVFEFDLPFWFNICIFIQMKLKLQMAKL